MSELFSDAYDNLLGALIVAGHFTIPEVCVFFNHTLLRGNRSIKASSEEFGAFSTPNLPALATVGTDIGRLPSSSNRKSLSLRISDRCHSLRCSLVGGIAPGCEGLPSAQVAVGERR